MINVVYKFMARVATEESFVCVRIRARGYVCARVYPHVRVWKQGAARVGKVEDILFRAYSVQI